MDIIRKLSEQLAPAASPAQSHPYSPREIVLDGFVPNDKQAGELLVTFAVVWVPIFAVTWWTGSRFNRSLKSLDKIIMMWFTMCRRAGPECREKRINRATGGCLHVFFEGWFVSNHHQVARAQDLFGQLWKEYSLSDSRYLTSDTFVLSAEILSVSVLGGLAWLMVYLIGVSSPYRHPVQAVICMGHIYSDLLYYATALLDHYRRGVDYCAPGAYYFWAYFVGMNFIWIIVPLGKCSFILAVEGY